VPYSAERASITSRQLPSFYDSNELQPAAVQWQEAESFEQYAERLYATVSRIGCVYAAVCMRQLISDWWMSICIERNSILITNALTFQTDTSSSAAGVNSWIAAVNNDDNKLTQHLSLDTTRRLYSASDVSRIQGTTQQWSSALDGHR